MRGLLPKLLCVVVLVLISSSAFAQDDNLDFTQPTLFFTDPVQKDFIGGGARARGMGGAGFGVYDFSTAASWNPAGLFRKENPLESPVMSIGMNVFSPTSEYRETGDFSATGIEGNQTFKFDDNFSQLGIFSLSVPVRFKGHPFVVSGVYANLDDEFYNSAFEFDTLVYFTGQDELDNILNPIAIHQRQKTYSGIRAINFGFGTRLYDNISFGATVNVYQGKSTVDRHWLFDAKNVPQEDLTGGQRVNLIIDSLDTDTSSYSGIYFTLGFMYQTEDLDLGLVIKKPHTLSQLTDKSIFRRETQNGLVEPDGSDTTYYDDNLVEIDQPLVIGVGGGYKGIENLLLAMDLEYRAFSGGEVKVREAIELIPGAADREYFKTFATNWRDVLAVRLGGEYSWHTGSTAFPLVPVRLGFSYAPTPYDGDSPDVELGIETKSVAVNRITGGFGLHWDQIRLDFAYVRSTVEVENRINITTIPNLSETLKSTYNSLEFTFTGYF